MTGIELVPLFRLVSQRLGRRASGRTGFPCLLSLCSCRLRRIAFCYDRRRATATNCANANERHLPTADWTPLNRQPFPAAPRPKGLGAGPHHTPYRFKLAYYANYKTTLFREDGFLSKMAKWRKSMSPCVMDDDVEAGEASSQAP